MSAIENDPSLEPEDPTLGEPENLEEPDLESEEPEEPELESEEPEVENRYQRLANRSKAAEEEAARLRMENEIYRQQMSQRQQSDPMDDLDPDERWRQQTQQQVNQALMQANDLADQAAYDRKAARNLTYEKYADRVESELKKVRAQGGNATREGILKYLIGEDALTNAGKQTRTQRTTSRRVAEARGTPVRNRPQAAPAPSPSGNSIEELEARLRDVAL